MKRGFALFLLTVSPVWCQVAKPAALTVPSMSAPKADRIPAQTISALERAFNYRLTSLAGADQPAELMGDTRGIQLVEFGVIFSAEVSLVTTPGLMPGRPKILPDMAAGVRAKRIERLPLLKAAMTEMMRSMGTAFVQIPPSQKIVLAVRLYYGSWEDTTGMPAQVVMRADRASAAAGRIDTEER